MTPFQLPLAAIVRLFAHAVEGMLILDPRGRVLAVNESYTTITGLSRKALIGQPVNLFRNADQLDRSPDAILDEVKKKGEWYGIVWNRRHNGEAYQEALTLVAVNTPGAEGPHIVALCLDMSLTDARGAEQRVRANHDPLTDLPNRLLFTDRLEQVLNHAQRSREQVVLLFFALDSFKKINESLGHEVGDQVLKQVADRIRRIIRKDDTLGRLSGDEFAIIFRNARQTQSAITITQKVQSVLLPPFLVGSHELSITASVGLSVFPMDGQDAPTLIRNANLALARAKQAGRNTFMFFTSAMATQATKRLILENSLRKALDNGEFELYYQPKVNVATGRVMGMEALIRWNQPGMGMVPPADFIAIAEESGLIVPMGQWVLETACRQNKAWIDAGLGPLRVAINLSARQFQVGHLNSTIMKVLDATGLPPNGIELEITESLMMADIKESIVTLRELSAMGLSVAVDDFGTGYSSLSYLRQFPINTIKIDRSFVSTMTEDSGDTPIVRAILSMAQSLNLSSVAEGVESVDQLRILADLGCDEYQGYYFSRPLPAGEFATLVTRLRLEEAGAAAKTKG
ncbi:MAG: EAL domain-containing protein [Magnetococcales bacterium]|nr:EAL domain-containing protein [Magnetococcales bacterium]